MHKTLKIAKDVFKTEIEGLLALEEMLGDSFIQAVNFIYKTKGRVIVTGMGKSGHIGGKIAATLASLGTPAFFLHPAEASHGDLGMITTKDVILALSNSGESEELKDIISYSRRFSIPMISVVSNPASSLGRNSDMIILLPKKPEACPMGLAPTTSTTMMLVLGDALAMALLDRRKFSKDEFRKRHPGGKLGRFLLKVQDIMQKGAESLPLVSPETSMADALIVMTRRNMGCVGVVNGEGELIGLVTDGDLKRHMSPDLLRKKISEIMSSQPKTVSPLLLATEAVGFMNECRITNVFVVAEGMQKPVGFLHIHDCLRAGIA